MPSSSWLLKLPIVSVSYTHLRAHETDSYLVCRLLLEKCVLTILELNWNQRLGHKKTKLNSCHHMLTSSTQLKNRSFHVVERTRTSSKCQKMKYARAKRAKLLFFIVKYANLWGFCCRRRHATENQSKCVHNWAYYIKRNRQEKCCWAKGIMKWKCLLYKRSTITWHFFSARLVSLLEVCSRL